MTDLLRAELARRRREETAAWTFPLPAAAPAADAPSGDEDDSLVLLFLCCHPSLAPAAQIALTLRAVGGLTTAEIARAFLVSEATMTRRITRAKQMVRDSGARFAMPRGEAYGDRLAVVLHVLYLIFNEGYATTAGEHLQRPEHEPPQARVHAERQRQTKGGPPPQEVGAAERPAAREQRQQADEGAVGGQKREAEAEREGQAFG